VGRWPRRVRLRRHAPRNSTGSVIIIAVITHVGGITDKLSWGKFAQRAGQCSQERTRPCEFQFISKNWMLAGTAVLAGNFYFTNNPSLN
jgi:hypothetical protein